MFLKCKAGWTARNASVTPEGHPVTLVNIFRGIPDFCLWDMTQISAKVMNGDERHPDCH